MSVRDPLKLPKKAVEAAIRADDQWCNLQEGGKIYDFNDMSEDEKAAEIERFTYVLRAFLREWLS